MTAGSRRKSRELAMQMLFQADIGKQTPEEVRTTFWRAGDAVEPEVRGFAEDLFRVANANLEQIDQLIAHNSKHWRIERMPAVDRNLLRMAIGEMLGTSDDRRASAEELRITLPLGTSISAADARAVARVSWLGRAAW